MVKLGGSALPNIAGISPSQISTSTPTGSVFMIGNGLNACAQQYWSVDITGTTWQWTQLGSAPSGTAPDGTEYYSGFTPSGGHQVRWGENVVSSTNPFVVQDGSYRTLSFSTTFDIGNPTFNNETYTAQTPLTYEAQASNGDSGGAVFSNVGGQWILSGIMTDLGGNENNPPAGAELFGDMTFIADLSLYHDQIAALMVPEPATSTLALVAVLLLAARRLRRWVVVRGW